MKRKDLRRKAKVISAAPIDARNLQFNVVQIAGDDEFGSTPAYRLMTYLQNGLEVGFIEYSEYVDKDSQPYVWVNDIEVYPTFQKNGIGLSMYKKFGEVYNEQYAGQPIKRNLNSSVDEYIYSKAVSLGYLPEMAMSEENIVRRNYQPTARVKMKRLIRKAK